MSHSLTVLLLPRLRWWWLGNTCRVIGPTAEVDGILRLSDNHCGVLGLMIRMETRLRKSSMLADSAMRGSTSVRQIYKRPREIKVSKAKRRPLSCNNSGIQGPCVAIHGNRWFSQVSGQWYSAAAVTHNFGRQARKARRASGRIGERLRR